MKPRAEVIGYMRFIGVPDALKPEDPFDIERAGQDAGSDLARLTETAGRTCYNSFGKGRNSAEYHQHILDVRHGNVLEHAFISFYVSGISRGCSHELVRHRAGCAISQRSTRYVDESESAWCWHPLMDHLDTTAPNAVAEQARAAYRQTVSNLESILVSRGTDKLTARKQARGAARGVLGNALETAMVWTANLRALRNVLEQRASEFADAEIRLLANALYEVALPICPEYLSDFEQVECLDGIGYGLKTAYGKV
jgi:thymidylate synthase (FAD)